MQIFSKYFLVGSVFLTGFGLLGFDSGIHILIFFLANLAKGNMSFCHLLVSVVCHPFTFHILIFSSENPQLNEQN
jgi:hypothetical protein